MIRLSKSIIDIKEVKAVEDVLLKDGYLGMGSYVKLFEEKISKYLNVNESNVVCVNSGTAALHLAVQAIICSDKKEILVPSLTYLSSFQAITAAGAIPIPCEVDYESMIIDVDDAKKRITKGTAAIMPVWYASNTYNYEKIYEFAKSNNLRIIEDAAHAFGCSFKNKKIGSIGDVVCFSFDGIKNITSGEGGAIVSNDFELINHCKDSRLLGVKKDTEVRFKGERSWDFDVENQGFRYHMSNIFAAIGIVQIEKLKSKFADKRRGLMNLYLKELTGLEEIKFQKLDKNCYIIPHIFPIRIKNGKRDKIIKILNENNIQTCLHYKPNHLLSKYKVNYNLEVTEKIYDEILTLPLHPGLKNQDIKDITGILKKYLK